MESIFTPEKVKIEQTIIPYCFEEDSEIISKEKAQVFLDLPSEKTRFKPKERITRKINHFLQQERAIDYVAKTFECYRLKGFYHAHILVGQEGVRKEMIVEILPQEIENCIDAQNSYCINEKPNF
ncbi:MAG: hypothetical protein ABEI53_02525 [Candidatus Magasanikbacteria bacterium]